MTMTTLPSNRFVVTAGAFGATAIPFVDSSDLVLDALLALVPFAARFPFFEVDLRRGAALVSPVIGI